MHPRSVFLSLNTLNQKLQVASLTSYIFTPQCINQTYFFEVNPLDTLVTPGL